MTTTLHRPRTVTARIDTAPPPPRTVTAHPEGRVVTVERRRLARIPSNRPTTSTWWLVVTETGERLLTHCPDTSYASVSVYLRGLMVSITARSIVDPADHPDVRREVLPEYSPGAQYCPLPFTHPAVQLR
ncbi:hypothetical protein OG883_45785 [Streptomyces sp. NBC_01142]|uniref:hypothetical protein n=1 Tax=Streptomyces sp. NBC_01142 TaxID=2975865 RepID=UPI00225C1C22|nr:hypothetical protein [Streptomyces sp. NBC_01142]MCX4826952.1 hypothetical protein [Streptomyces sp. NBC_01142]